MLLMILLEIHLALFTCSAVSTSTRRHLEKPSVILPAHTHQQGESHTTIILSPGCIDAVFFAPRLYSD